MAAITDAHKQPRLGGADGGAELGDSVVDGLVMALDQPIEVRAQRRAAREVQGDRATRYSISICSAGYPPPIIKAGQPSPKLLAAPVPGSDKQRQVIRACSGQHFGTQANVW